MIEPVFGYTRDGITPHKPNLKEILSEWLDATNFTADSSRTLIALNCIFFASLGLAFGWYVIHFLSLATLLFLMASLIFIGTVYNTLWYHRYCSHHAFKFARQDFARVLLWTTPLFFRESTYAIPHRIHHQYIDKPGDPYGPHLGWLGSFLAIDSSMKLNSNVT